MTCTVTVKMKVVYLSKMYQLTRMNGAICHITGMEKHTVLGAEALGRIRELHLQHDSVSSGENHSNMRRRLVWYHVTDVWEKRPEHERRISLRDVGSNVT
jgi:hypothetical protein